MFLNNDIFSIKKGIPWQQDGDKALILDADEHFAHELNSTALFIWQNINTPKSYKQLCSNFINEFDASEDLLLRDLNETLSLLQELKLVQVERT